VHSFSTVLYALNIGFRMNSLLVETKDKSTLYAPILYWSGARHWDPTTGTAPYPVIIAYSGLSVPVPPGIAVITFDNSEMGQQNDQSSRGVGLFYDLYGSNATASSMMAWA